MRARAVDNEKKKKYDPPLIQLKAKKIIHDKKKLNVKYYDAFLDVAGKSILYLPYFSHPSPLVKRKKGFLPPSFAQTHYFGLATNIPYYYPLSEYSDVTVTPKFSQKKNPAFLIQHRKNFKNGEMKNEFSGTIENQELIKLKKIEKEVILILRVFFFSVLKIMLVIKYKEQLIETIKILINMDMITFLNQILN